MKGLQYIISKRSNYSSEDPYWINLHRDVANDKDRDVIAKHLLDWFNKYGSDAADDFASTESCSMSYRTAEKALNYALKKGKIKDIQAYELIDGGFSQESDGRENDPVTGKLLHCIPINRSSIIDELTSLLETESLSKDDWVFVDYVYNSISCSREDEDMEVIRLIRDIIIKHY